MKMLALCFVFLILWGCSSKERGSGYDFLKTPSDFNISIPDSTKPHLFLLSWQAPRQKDGYLGSHVFFDTAQWEELNIPQNFGKARGPHKEFLKGKGERDSLLFSLDTTTTQNFKAKEAINGIPYFVISSKGHLDSAESVSKFDFALISLYDGDNGQPIFTPLTVDDQFKPESVNLKVDFTDTQIQLSWVRPKDATSSFFPFADSGKISAYHLTLKNLTNINSTLYHKIKIDSVAYTLNGKTALIKEKDFKKAKEGTLTYKNTKQTTDNGDSLLVPWLSALFLDGFPKHPTHDSNKVKLVLYGLSPNSSYSIQMFAEDSSGNIGKNDAELITIVTTDTTQPTKPTATVDSQSITKNQFTFSWLPSQDTRKGDTKPNTNILEYRIIRRQTSSTGKIDTLIIVVNTKDILSKPSKQEQSFFEFKDGRFEGSFFFLPPSTLYDITIQAIDSTFYRSDTSTFTLRTLDVSNTINCPSGFLPIPARDSTKAFCIEAYEHLDTNTQEFTVNVDFNKAIEICNSLDSNLSTTLCTESQWVRACEGGDTKQIHRYGIQSIVSNEKDTLLFSLSSPTSILQSKCNQAVNDKEMAHNLTLRNPLCISNEGVFDMSGNFSEWVVSDTSANTLLFKGGNYLLPSLDLSKAQQRAECKHQGFPRQKRPLILKRCLSTKRQLALIYKTSKNIDTVDCPSLAGHILSINIANANDSSKLEINYNGNEPKETITLIVESDSIKKHPPKIALFDSLLVVSITSKEDSLSSPQYDTLGYTDILNSGISLVIDSLPSTHPVLTREINTQYWEIKPLQIIYAYIVPQPQKPYSKKAKRYYSNKVIGFRCCSNPQ